MSRHALTVCDGCGSSTTGSSAAKSTAGWRVVRVSWTDETTTTTGRNFDVCPDPMCAARVVDATRADRPLRLVRGGNHPSQAADQG